MRYILIVVWIFLLFGCKYFKEDVKRVSTDVNVSYDIEIDYSSMNTGDDRSMAGGDSVAIGFVGEFYKDTVDIFKNHKFYKTITLTSDSQTDDAGHEFVDKYQTLDDIGVRINGGPLVFIETRRQDYHVNLKFYGNQVNVKFYKYLPATY